MFDTNEKKIEELIKNFSRRIVKHKRDFFEDKKI
jgi:hypothetical protein